MFNLGGSRGGVAPGQGAVQSQVAWAGRGLNAGLGVVGFNQGRPLAKVITRGGAHIRDHRGAVKLRNVL